MGEDSKLGAKIKSQITRFAGRLTEGMDKVKRRFVTEMLYGIQAPKEGTEQAEWIADIYLTRWKCEEAYRFIKQSYHLEDMRVRSYIGLRNTCALVHAIFYFVSVMIGAKAKLNLIFKKVCEKAKRFYEITPFFQCAIADGIHRLLFASRTGPHEPPTRPPTGQLAFPFLNPLL
jgi:hypothetical protein